MARDKICHRDKPEVGWRGWSKQWRLRQMPSDIQKSLSKGKKLNVGGVTLCQRLPGLSAVGSMEWQAVGEPRQVMAPVRGPSGPAPPSCPSVTLVTWDPCPACSHHAPWAEDTPSPSLNPRLRQLWEVSLNSYLEGCSLIGRGDQHWPICLQAGVSRNRGAHPSFSGRWKASSWPCRRQPFRRDQEVLELLTAPPTSGPWASGSQTPLPDPPPQRWSQSDQRPEVGRRQEVRQRPELGWRLFSAA